MTTNIKHRRADDSAMSAHDVLALLVNTVVISASATLACSAALRKLAEAAAPWLLNPIF